MTNEAYDNTTTLDPRIAQRLKHDDKGLVAAVIQQFDTKEVLMVGYMNDEAIRRTLTTGRVTPAWESIFPACFSESSCRPRRR